MRTHIILLTEFYIERLNMTNFGGYDGESSMASNESSYTLEMMGSRYLNKNIEQNKLPYQDPMNWKAKVNAGANFVSRTGQHATLDKYMTGSTGTSKNKRSTVGAKTLGSSFSRPSAESGRNQGLSGDTEKETRAQLVVMRTRQENCRDFLAYCGNSAATGPWSKRASRSVPAVTSCIFKILI